MGRRGEGRSGHHLREPHRRRQALPLGEEQRLDEDDRVREPLLPSAPEHVLIDAVEYEAGIGPLYDIVRHGMDTDEPRRGGPKCSSPVEMS